jgi:chemotaxis protein MotB
MATRSWLSRTIGLGWLSPVALVIAGCGLVPKERLDECRKMSQTVQAENAKLKDQTVSLRSQNQELRDREEEDYRRLRAQKDAIHRLEESVQAYRTERDQLASSFDRLKVQIASLGGQTSLSANTSPRSLGDQLETLARSRPGVEFDARGTVLRAPAEALFEPGSDRLTPEAIAWLDEVAQVLAEAGTDGLEPRVVVPAGESAAVDRADLGHEDRAHARFLDMARATRVRDRLASKGGLKLAPIALAGAEVSDSQTGAADAPRDADDHRIAIELRPHDRDSPVVTTGHAATPPEMSSP